MNEQSQSHSPSAVAPPATPTQTQTTRRPLKRNSAACERCRRRKQKCDGKLPSCGPCLLVQARCVPSDRLLIRVDPNCQYVQAMDRLILLITATKTKNLVVPKTSHIMGAYSDPRLPSQMMAPD
ncbi:hypothetical protein NCS52_01484300 [Fusarium sp. LHS14.1]|nr:hypothetical protein NCS52_01484300 [Fusarium sp. LHS14.1]